MARHLLRALDQFLGSNSSLLQCGDCLGLDIPLSVVYDPAKQEESENDRYPDYATGGRASIVEADPAHCQGESDKTVRY